MVTPDKFVGWMMEQWSRGAEMVGASMKLAAGMPGANGDVAGAFAQWQEAFSRLSTLQGRYLDGVLEGLGRAARTRLDAQTFSQLERMATANWEHELGRMSGLPAELAERTRRADPGRLSALVQSMVSEYVRDLAALGPDSLQIDYRPLAEAWGKVLGGSVDEEAGRAVERFVQAMAVKTRHGPEYYADPASTPVGQTPRELVARFGKIELHRYLPPEDAPERTGDPVLVVYSVINKSYIEDLMPGHSFIEHLLAEGLDVYMIEWGPTEPGDRTTTFDSYIDPGLAGCVDAILEQTGKERVSLFGHCIGGNFALIYAALHPDKVARLLTLTTPGTAAEGGVVALWTDRDVFPVDAIIDSYGHMPAKLIRYTFMALKPYYEVMKWKMFIENIGNDRVMKLFEPVDRWANENVDIPGEVFRSFIHEFFHQDRFRRGQTRVCGQTVDPAAITCPFLNMAATRDWIVPIDSARMLNDLVKSEQNHFVPIEGAHVGIMIDPRSRPLWSTMSDFLGGKEVKF